MPEELMACGKIVKKPLIQIGNYVFGRKRITTCVGRFRFVKIRPFVQKVKK